MQILVYLMFAGVIVVALVAAIVVGGWMWIAPVLALLLTGAYAVVDRRLRRRQQPQERLVSEINPD